VEGRERCEKAEAREETESAMVADLASVACGMDRPRPRRDKLSLCECKVKAELSFVESFTTARLQRWIGNQRSG
jgi:hypothetical protein